MNMDVKVELEIILSVFELPTRVISRHMLTNVLELCRTFRVINKMATTYGY